MFLIILAVCTAIFHLYTASIAVMPGYILTAVHWALIAAFIILTKPMKIKGGIIIDIALIAVTIYLSVYSVMLQQRIIFNPGVFSQIDYIWSVVAIVVALIIGVRALGWMLPTICVTFILYAFLGNHIPGMFQTVSFSGKRIATYLFSMTDGLYGMTLLVSAQYLFLFIFFGCIMDISGAGEFFVDIANSVAGRARGGPAQAAIYSSMLLGMVNGSGAANVATTGTFTIPLMKKTGYKPSMAGATEAASSCGGQIMPPVMGAVAFLMSETTGIAYSKIAIAAFVPAVLYYMTLSCSVYFILLHF
jgi:TRAP transporter 4TM/12TM fusion protein